MYGAECMNYSKSACWVFSGLILAASEVNAQEAGQDILQSAESEARLPVGIDAYEKLLDDAEALMKAGKPGEAYKLLEPLEFEHSGEVRFDYLIGIAALDSGMPDKATLAFERVLAEDPEFAGARLDMARAYYQLGDMSRAKTEFEIVLAQQPSDTARATIERYLADISDHEIGKQTRISGYIEGTVGRDTNVNNASETPDNIVIPTLNPNTTEIADNYFGLAAGGEVMHSLNRNFRLYAGADVSQHDNFRQKDFNTSRLEERFGMIYDTRTDRYRIGLYGSQNTQGGASYYKASGLNAEWRHAIGFRDQFNVLGQYIQYRYADPALQLNDINQQTAGVGWLHVFGDNGSTLSGSLYYGTEDDVGPASLANPGGGRTDGAKRFGGMRIGGQATGGRVKVYFSAGEQLGEFADENPTIDSQRTDRLDDVTLGAYWYLDQLWTANLQFTRYVNMSNVETDSYDRSDYSFAIRRNIK
jgi:tetratricopeptide (TPR) repeat protein